MDIVHKNRIARKLEERRPNGPPFVSGCDLVKAALALHKRGLAVVPIPRAGFEYKDRKGQTHKATGKGPIIRGWQKRQLSREELGGLLQDDHVVGIGVVAGALSGNLAVLDFDGAGWQGAFEHFRLSWTELENAPIVETGSGKRHIWLRCPDMPTDFTKRDFVREDLKAKIELRGNRCNCIVPPSLHPSGGQYRWVSGEADWVEVPFAELLEWLTEWVGEHDNVATEPPAAAQRVPLGRKALEFVAHGAPVGTQRPRALAAARNYLSAGYSVQDTIEAIWRGLEISPQGEPDEPWSYEDAVEIVRDLASRPAPPLKPLQHTGNPQAGEGEEGQETDKTKGVKVLTRDLAEGTLIEAAYEYQGARAYMVVKWGDDDRVETKEGSITIAGVTYEPLINTDVKWGALLLPPPPIPYQDGMTLRAEIEEWFQEWAWMGEDFARVVAQFVMYTWLFENFSDCPYLRFLGDWGTGKSRAGKAVRQLCYHCVDLGSSATEAVLFRTLDEYRGTAWMDEAQFRPGTDRYEAFIQILNAGENRRSIVRRCDEHYRFRPRAYVVGGPKVIAAREEFSDAALNSRCITHVMHKAPAGQVPDNEPIDPLWPGARELQGKLLSYRLKHHQARPTYVARYESESIEPRIRQITYPLAQLPELEDAEGVAGRIRLDLQAHLMRDLQASKYAALLTEIVARIDRGDRFIYLKDLRDPIREELGWSNSVSSKTIKTWLEDIGLGTKKQKQGLVVDWTRPVLEAPLARYGVDPPKAWPEQGDELPLGYERTGIVNEAGEELLF